MDSTPFFEFNLTTYRESDVEELKRFTQSAYDLNDILTTASELKYTREIQRLLADQLQKPEDEFVRFFASKVYPGRMTQTIREQFTQATQRAFRQFINDQINERLKTALGADAQVNTMEHVVLPSSASPTPLVEPATAPIVTTTEELEGFYTIRALLYSTVNPRRIVMRDVQSYCGILLDDNNRKPICRLYFNSGKKYWTHCARSAGSPGWALLDRMVLLRQPSVPRGGCHDSGPPRPLHLRLRPHR